MKIYYQYSNRTTLPPVKGDFLNEIGICLALSSIADVYVSGKRFDSKLLDYGLEESRESLVLPAQQMRDLVDLYWIRANRDVFNMAKGRLRLWVAAPYDVEAFQSADAIVVFTNAWGTALRRGKRIVGLNPDGRVWPNVVVARQPLKPNFVPRRNHKKSLKIRSTLPGRFVIGHFGRLVPSSYPTEALKAVSKLNRSGADIVYLFATTRCTMPPPRCPWVTVRQFKQREMPYAMSACDAIVLGDRRESFDVAGSLTGVEALGCGVPVVCGESAARREVFGEDYPFFVPWLEPFSVLDGRVMKSKIEEALFNSSGITDRVRSSFLSRSLDYSVTRVGLEISAQLERLLGN